MVPLSSFHCHNLNILHYDGFEPWESLRLISLILEEYHNVDRPIFGAIAMEIDYWRPSYSRGGESHHYKRVKFIAISGG